jgi:hypothetical protein
MGRSDGQLCDQNFWDFRWKSFLFKSRIRTVRHCLPDGSTFAASNFHIRFRASRPWGMAVRTVNLQRAISIFDKCASGPCWQTSGRLSLNCELALRRSASGRESMSSGRLNQSSLIWTWKESEAWSITERRPDGLLACLVGCKLEQKLLDTVEGPNRNPHRPDEWCLVCQVSGRYGTSSGRLD